MLNEADERERASRDRGGRPQRRDLAGQVRDQERDVEAAGEEARMQHQ